MVIIHFKFIACIAICSHIKRGEWLYGNNFEMLVIQNGMA